MPAMDARFYACYQCRYPTTVATLSRRARTVIEAGFVKSSEGGAESPLLGASYAKASAMC